MNTGKDLKKMSRTTYCPFSHLPCKNDCELMFGEHCAFVALAEDMSDMKEWGSRCFYMLNGLYNHVTQESEAVARPYNDTGLNNLDDLCKSRFQEEDPPMVEQGQL